MTSARAPQLRSGALARGRRNFRRWRRRRPFWGGLFTILSGLQIFASTQLSLGDIQLRIGTEGFLSYLIPLVLVLAGSLIWFTPQQRIFYGVIAVAVAVYSFIGVNFGGFFIGMLLGILGGALAVAWAPVTLDAPPAGDLGAGTAAGSPALGSPAADGTGPDEAGPHEAGPGGAGRGEEYDRAGAPTSVDELRTGPLTDVLPAPVNPLAGHPAAEPARTESREQRGAREQAEQEHAEGEAEQAEQGAGRAGPEEAVTQPLPRHRPAAPQATPPTAAPPVPSSGQAQADDTDPDTPLPRRGPRFFALSLIPVILATAALPALPGPGPGGAAACPTPTPTPTPSVSGSASSKPAPSQSGSKPAPGARPAPGGGPASGGATTRTPSPTPGRSSPSAGAPGEDGRGPVGDLLGGIGGVLGDLLGRGTPAPTPSPTSAGGGSTGAPAGSPNGKPAGGGSAGKPAGNGSAGQPATPGPARPGSASPSASTSPTSSVSASPTPTASGACPSQSPAPAKQLAVADGQPLVQKVPDRMTGSKLSLFGFSFDGVVDLPTATGTIRCLQFSMDRAVTEDFQLRIPGPDGHTISLRSSALTVQRESVKVKFYASRFHGRLLGIPLTFTPDLPPPLTLPVMVFTDIDIQLVFVDTDRLLAPDLTTELLD